MLDNIRKHTTKIMWFIAAIFIGGIFFWYGSGGRIQTAVIETDDFNIDVSDYRGRLNRTLRNIRSEEGELSEQKIDETKQQVLSSMLNTETLYNEATKIKLTVTDREVAYTIRNLPQFQQDGNFNQGIYKQSLSYSMNMTPAEFEELVRKDLYTKKIERVILSAADTTVPEIKLAYLMEHQSLNNFENDKEKTKNAIIRQKRLALYQQWMTYLRRNMNIKVNPQLAGLE